MGGKFESQSRKRERERDLSETTHMYLLIKNITMGDEVKKGVWPI